MPIISPSNLEYLGSKPNFTRDTYDTLAKMQAALEDGHIDVGHQTYCIETGITYKAVPNPSGGLMWEDTIGDLREDLTQKILDDERVTSEAFWDLNERVQKTETELFGDGDGSSEDTKLGQVWKWYDEQTHLPVFETSWAKKTSGNLRQGTTKTYTANFSWDWANRAGSNGVMTKVGSADWTTKTFEELGKSGAVKGGSVSIDVPVTLGTSAVTLSAKFDNGQAQSDITVTPLSPSRTWSATGLPETWVTLSPTGIYQLTIKVVGANLPESSVGDRIIGSSGNILKTLSSVDDSNVVASETINVTVGTSRTYTLSWKKRAGTIIDSYSYTATPCFIVISGQTNAWDGTAQTFPSFFINSRGGYQSWSKSGPTTLPQIEFTAGSTLVYLSQTDIRGLGAKSLARGSDTWATITGFSKSGTVEYLGKTYYYLMNPNIGAGIFSFKFV